MPPERIPEDVGDRAALYRQCLADTRTLVVLDNAVDETQVRPLLPGESGCLVLVTSRQRLKGLDSHTLSLDVLPRSDALALVETVTGRALPELAEITELCGRLAPGNAIWVPCSPCPTGVWTTPGSGSSDCSGWFPVRTPTPTRPPPWPTPTRTRPHDLIRLYARTLARDDPDRDAALERLLDHYLLTANRAESLVTRFPGAEVAGPLPDADAAWAWLRAERANLLAALRHAIVRDHAERIVALTAGLATLLHVDGPWTEAISLHIMATAAARHVGDRSGQARSLTWLGDVRGATGDFSGAIRDLCAALRLSRDMGDHRAQANALTRLGQIRGFTDDHAGAIRDLGEALDLCRRWGEQRGQANALTMLGQVRGMSGELPSAARDLRAALELARSLGDRGGQANALNRLGQIHRRTGDYRGALRDLHDALALHLGDRTGEAVALACIGEVRGLLGDHPEAIRDLSEALDLFQRLGERHGQANTLTMLGQIRGRTGDHPGAIRDLRTGLDLFRRTGAHGNEVWALNHYATVLAATGNRPQALTIHHDALDQARRTHQPEHEATAMEGIGECHLCTGDTETGRIHLKQALEIFRRLSMAPDADRVRSRLAQLALRGG